MLFQVGVLFLIKKIQEKLMPISMTMTFSFNGLQAKEVN